MHITRDFPHPAIVTALPCSQMLQHHTAARSTTSDGATPSDRHESEQRRVWDANASNDNNAAANSVNGTGPPPVTQINPSSSSSSPPPPQFAGVSDVPAMHARPDTHAEGDRRRSASPDTASTATHRRSQRAVSAAASITAAQSQSQSQERALTAAPHRTSPSHRPLPLGVDARDVITIHLMDENRKGAAAGALLLLLLLLLLFFFFFFLLLPHHSCALWFLCLHCSAERLLLRARCSSVGDEVLSSLSSSWR